MTPGNTYTTKCVRACLSTTSPPEWIPVIGPAHDDTEIIRFNDVHLHIDWRFLGPRQRAKVMTLGGDVPQGIVITVVYPNDGSGPIAMDKALKAVDTPNESFLKEKRKIYHGPFPPYPEEPPPHWLPALSKAYRDATLTPEQACPHRGTDLSDVEPDDQGRITCPLHGLRWRVDTGAAEPQNGDLSDSKYGSRKSDPASAEICPERLRHQPSDQPNGRPAATKARTNGERFAEHTVTRGGEELTQQQRKMPYLESHDEEEAYRKGYKRGQEARRHEQGDPKELEPVSLEGASRHEVAAFGHGYRDGQADSESDVSATLVQCDEWYYRIGYERAMAELENWQPGQCQHECGHRICVSVIPALIRSAAAIGSQEGCSCDTCASIRRIEEAHKTITPPEPIDGSPTPVNWTERHQGNEDK